MCPSSTAESLVAVKKSIGGAAASGRGCTLSVRGWGECAMLCWEEKSGGGMDGEKATQSWRWQPRADRESKRL